MRSGTDLQVCSYPSIAKTNKKQLYFVCIKKSMYEKDEF